MAREALLYNWVADVPDISECITPETVQSNDTRQERVSHLCCLWQSVRRGEDLWLVATLNTSQLFSASYDQSVAPIEKKKKKERFIASAEQAPILKFLLLFRNSSGYIQHGSLKLSGWDPTANANTRGI